MLSACLLTAWQSGLYGYDYEVPDMPLLLLAGWLVFLGLAFLLLPGLIRKTLKDGETGTVNHAGQTRHLLLFILAIGLLARLIMFFSTPMMEDDFQRYMWDGAVTAHGYNPYSISPKKVLDGENSDPVLARLAEQSGTVLQRVNHPGLRTIYPPVAQGVFALAYYIKPFSLNAWRLVALLSELAAVGFLLGLLSLIGRPAIWIALYWWNPLVIKELANSVHMDVLLVPCLLGALYFGMKKRYTAVTLFVLMATAIKIWPVVLLPVLLRPLWPDWRKIALLLTAFTLSLALVMSPIFLAGLDQSSGFVAYVQKWQTNSAFFPAFKSLWQTLLQPLGVPDKTIGLIVRLLVVMTVGLTALRLSWKSISGHKDMAARVFIISATMFLLSPAQFPWYALWVLPLSVLFPITAFSMLSATLPLYYLGFHLMVIERHDLFTGYVVWIIWLPIWLALAWHFRHTLSGKITHLKSGSGI